MLGKAAINKIHSAIEDLFERAKARFLGPSVGGKKLALVFNKDLSLPGVYEAAAKDDGATPDKKTLDSMISVASSYMDAQKERTKAQVVKEVNDFISNAENRGEAPSAATVLGGKLSEVWGKVSSDVRRIVDTEVQNGRAMGALEGIVQINAYQGIDDPTMMFVIVRDGLACEECVRLHMLEDGVTPRVWKLSEISHGYHKKGDDHPSMSGEHPHCRCQPANVPPGYGFTSEGFLKFISHEHDEFKKQRGG